MGPFSATRHAMKRATTPTWSDVRPPEKGHSSTCPTWAAAVSVIAPVGERRPPGPNSPEKVGAMSIVLYHNPISTCGQKVRLAFAEKGLSFESRVIDWGKREHLSDWYLKLNPNGVVPTLVHDGAAVIDSSVICEYLDEMSPAQPLAPRSALGRAQMRAWMRYSEEVSTPAIRVPSFNRMFVKGLRSMPATDYDDLVASLPLRKHFYQAMGKTGFSEQAYDQAIEKLDQTLRRMEGALGDGRPFLLGDYSLADIVFVPTIVRMDDIGLSAMWADRPRVAAWFAAVRERPSFDIAYYEGSRVDPEKYVESMQEIVWR